MSLSQRVFRPGKCAYLMHRSCRLDVTARSPNRYLSTAKSSKVTAKNAALASSRGMPRLVKFPTYSPKIFSINGDPDNPDLDAKLSITTLPVQTPQDPHIPFTHCVHAEGMVPKILATPGFPGRLPTPPPSYRIGTSAGAGLGLFATRDLNPCDLILVERPLALVPAATNTLEPDELSTLVLQNMSTSMRDAFMALSNCKDHTSTFFGILATNAFGVALPGHSVPYAGVCDHSSRINHSCSPNAQTRWDLGTFAVYLHALRPIASGEEIFISYTDSLEPRQDRRATLQDRYGFECACTVCRLPAAKSAASDRRRHALRMGSMLMDSTALNLWASDLTHPDDYIIKQCTGLWALMEAEGGCGYPEAVWPTLVQHICKAYCALGDLDSAREWAETGAWLTEVFLGDDGGWKQVAEGPQNTAWWELRVKAQALAGKK